MCMGWRTAVELVESIVDVQYMYGDTCCTVIS